MPDQFFVLWAANIATTHYRRPGHEFEATAAQIAEYVRSDAEEYGTPYGDADAVWVGARLRLMAMGCPTRPEPLVERVDTRRWRMTKAGVKVLSA